MAIVTLSHVTKSYGANRVLTDVSLQLARSEKVGLIGSNGSGKTTLLDLISGRVLPDQGEAHKARSLRIGYLMQEPKLDGGLTVFQETRRALASVDQLADEMRDLLVNMSRTEATDTLRKLAARYSALETRFETQDGYGLDGKAERVLSGLGFAADDFGKPVELLSGGERSRVALARVLLLEPDLLLLDEPTNHLDVRATEWLEKFVSQYPGAAIVVSHDRYFLNKVAFAILELDGGHVKRYPGNYDRYVAQRENALLAMERARRQQEQRIKHDEDFIRRYHYGQRHREARSRQRKLEKLEPIEKLVTQRTLKKLEFKTHGRGGDRVVELHDLTKRFDDRVLFAGLGLEIGRGERLGIIGPNGSGKTTLLRIILGDESPSAGSVRLGRSVRVGYLPQDRLHLGPENTVLEEAARTRPDLKEEQLRSYLGRFLFSQEDVFKKVRILSGGEQTRLALAKLMLSPADLLVLDEPTNHLDIPSRIALEEALLGFPGTVILVSHDRYLLDKTVSMLIMIDEGRAFVHRGNYSSYVSETREKTRSYAPPRPEGRRPRGRETRPSSEPRRKRELETIEQAILRKEETLERLSESLATPQTYNDPEFVKKLKAECEQVQKELAALYSEWDNLASVSGERE